MAKASNKGAPAPAQKTPRAAKGATQAAPTATPAPVQTEAAPAKAKRPPAVVQNGVQRPKAGGLCAAVWELTEAGRAWGEALPFSRNGHSGYQILWKLDVADRLKEVA